MSCCFLQSILVFSTLFRLHTLNLTIISYVCMGFNKNNLLAKAPVCCLSQSGSRSLNGLVKLQAKIGMLDRLRNVWNQEEVRYTRSLNVLQPTTLGSSRGQLFLGLTEISSLSINIIETNIEKK